MGECGDADHSAGDSECVFGGRGRERGEAREVAGCDAGEADAVQDEDGLSDGMGEGRRDVNVFVQGSGRDG